MQQPYQQPFQQPMQQQPFQQQQQGGQGQNPHGQMINGKLKQTGFQRLESRAGIFVRQKIDWTEAITGCDQPNTYQVFGINSQGEKKGDALFICQEKSNCCIRQFCSPACRPLQVQINTRDKNFEDLDNEPFLKIDRPCACTIACLNRPEMKVTCVENGKEEFIGKIVDPFNFCNLQVNLYDTMGNCRYKIEGSCCQLGLWCKLPCEPCQTIDFDINNQIGDKLSTMQKKSAGCLASALTDASNFSVTFPPNATKEDKALFLVACIFLDFRYFEEPVRKADNKGNVIVVNEGD
jgi:hypothetical protein